MAEEAKAEKLFTDVGNMTCDLRLVDTILQNDQTKQSYSSDTEFVIDNHLDWSVRIKELREVLNKFESTVLNIGAPTMRTSKGRSNYSGRDNRVICGKLPVQETDSGIASVSSNTDTSSMRSLSQKRSRVSLSSVKEEKSD